MHTHASKIKASLTSKSTCAKHDLPVDADARLVLSLAWLNGFLHDGILFTLFQFGDGNIL